MKESIKWAFIHDRDEFVRLSLNKILKKYGFQVIEIEDFYQLGDRKKDIKEGMILADIDVEVLERWLPFLKKWSDRLILMSPLVTDDLIQHLKKMGIYRIIKKPVDPILLRKLIREIFFPDKEKRLTTGKKRE